MVESLRRPSIRASLDADERRRVALLAAVADPIRIALLRRLDRPRSVTELLEGLGLAQPTISHHLAILRESGLVEARRDGRRRLYDWTTTPDPAVGEIQSLVRRWFGATAPGAPPETPPAPGRVELEDFLL